MKQREQLLEANGKYTIPLIIIILLIPVTKLAGYKIWFARLPQYWLWLSCCILLFALYQKNNYIKAFLIYCLGLAIYYDFIVGKIIKVKTGETLLIRDFTINSMITLMTLCAVIFLINIISKVNLKHIKLAVTISVYIVLYFWIYNKFAERWIAGAYLAFSLPLILSLTKYTWINVLLTFAPLCGVFHTKSSMAILSTCIGLIVFFILKEQYKNLYCLFSILIILTVFFFPSNFTKHSFRKKFWEKSLFYKGKKAQRTIKDTIIGTGLRTYNTYKFMEGQKTLVSHAHNEFLEVFCEEGLIGLLILFFFIIDLLKVNAPAEYKTGLIICSIHCFGYYAARLAMTGILIILYIGILEKYRRFELCVK